jgi:hypothetical protein
VNSVQLESQLPTGLSAQQMRAQMNNQYAQALAAGDPRYQMKQLDRPGLSRGRAQMNQAGINAAQQVSEGIAQAYSQDLQNRQYNANLSLGAQSARESQAQALGGLQQQNNYANQMAALQRQQMGMNLVSSLLGGLLK